MSRKASRGKVATFGKATSTFTTDVDFPCPFCTGTVSASVKACAVMHTMPICVTFDRLQPEEFMHACNVEVAKRKAMN